MNFRASSLIATASLFCPCFAQDKSAPAPQAAASNSANSLARALATFATLDADHDGTIDAREGERLDGLRPGELATEDSDGDGRLSRAEFLVLYRQVLLRSGQRAAPDLEQETARVQALRRARAALSDRRWVAGGDPAMRAFVARSAARPALTDGRLLEALGELERSVLSGRASAAAFASVRAAWSASQRDTGNGMAAGQRSRVAAADVERALAELEAEVRSGGARNVVRLRALRELLTGTPREPGTSSAVSRLQASPPTTPPALRIVRIESALEDLQRSLEARSATELDLARVRGLVSAACRQSGIAESNEAREIERLFGELATLRAQDAETRATFDELRKRVLANVVQPAPEPVTAPPPAARESEAPPSPPRR